jgi:hypothetical protein
VRLPSYIWRRAGDNSDVSPEITVYKLSSVHLPTHHDWVRNNHTGPDLLLATYIDSRSNQYLPNTSNTIVTCCHFLDDPSGPTISWLLTLIYCGRLLGKDVDCDGVLVGGRVTPRAGLARHKERRFASVNMN